MWERTERCLKIQPRFGHILVFLYIICCCTIPSRLFFITDGCQGFTSLWRWHIPVLQDWRLSEPGAGQSVLFGCSGTPKGCVLIPSSACCSMEAGIVFSLSKPAAACRENLTCFVDYVQTLSCLLRNDLGASSYNVTATWYVLIEHSFYCNLFCYSDRSVQLVYVIEVDYFLWCFFF